ncbi:MAG: heme-copper oxidase subunit III [Candidatus Limnocylindrales bacterium]
MTASTALTTTPADVHGAEHDRGISNPILGMVLFICSEVMFFGGLFAAYFNVRANAPVWPPSADTVGPNLAFEFDLHRAPLYAFVLTCLLVLSSFTCQMGVWAIRRDDRRGLVRAFAVTLVLGITFLVGQIYDYTQLGFGLSDGTFGTTFYTLTGFHGAHVFAGAVMLSVVLYRGLSGQFSARHHDAVEATSLYWHFVDVVWVALFSILYVIPTH